MDQHQRGRSPSGAADSQHHINQSHSPSPARPFDPNNVAASSMGLGLGIDPSSQQQQFSGTSQPDFSTYNNGFLTPSALGQDPAFDINQSFGDQLKADSSSQFGQNFLTPQANFTDDFTIFPTSSADQSNAPLFVDNQQLGTPDMNAMAASQAHHSPTPPHLLRPEPHQPGSAHQSPSFNQHQFSSPPGSHSRNVSLGPEAALLPQFQGHRRTPSASEYSDVSSVTHSPNLVGQDSFDGLEHSPMQRPQDGALYSELHGIGTFSISDHSSPNQGLGRSPSHSPAISPRILPQSMPELGQAGLMLQGQNGMGQGYGMPMGEAFPALPQMSVTDMAQDPSQQMPQMAAPTIEIDYAPTAQRSVFDGNKPSLDTDALTPPERGRFQSRRIGSMWTNDANFTMTGRPRSRPRAHTDPFNNGGAVMGRPSPSSSLSPNPGSESSRSLSPFDRTGTSPNRRRQSTSAVPNNVMALRLADPEFAATVAGDAGGSAAGGPKRVQKHPATFQCTLCPKRFTRAYNLRSHLRTHTDERPFVCTVCGKAFARQHDRKRHEGLHSGEKKFVCKGDLKAGGQWGCGRRFARADALGRHFRSEAGRICIKPLLDEEMMERQRAWHEQNMQAQAQQNMMMAPQIDPSTGFAIDASGQYALPAALLAQYPALAQMNWAAADMSGGGGGGGGGSGLEDDLSGRSSFDASDYDENDDGGYVSGPGTGFGQGGMGEGFGEMGYASDYGGR
ncbi:uncharacterized protein E0L32_006843 [Thyridium curvatum]|uniref:C2H2-type domain-containing protein n=1 Tax=Thyridium curvatum TaxID=1093900 RepID=A0A507B5X7_9PEZI|nr:uncharacterized protein E0L32_006843 [Thyridium curvatum]TPX12431.1 hypothetical protein E0L32_006843 [Thyridium curvatum]